jgi:hypothetical protein
MLRTLTGLGIALALVGSAHAQDQIVITTHGKSEPTLKAELYQAARNVCTDTVSDAALVDSQCVEATYVAALQQLHAARPAALQRTAYQARTSSTGL